MTKIDYELTGCANGHPVRIEGRGIAERGRLQLAFSAAEPVLGFDASLAHLAGIDALVAVVQGLVAPHDTAVVARCRVDLFTEGGAEVGTIVAHAASRRRFGAYRCEVELADARVAVEPGERVIGVGERELRAASVLGSVVVLSSGTVETSRGREWMLLATTILPACEPGRRAVLALPATR
ncbi:MAG: hypothetical protein K8J09_15965 [Planctomycetes bacterium]|nr:hypothetical protein [Planctomycetota bacterium]